MGIEDVRDKACIAGIGQTRVDRDPMSNQNAHLARAMKLALDDAGLTPDDIDGIVPGSVPPFGEPLLSFPLHLDAQIPQNERIAFNAGSLEHSFIMSVEDYLPVARPARIFEFSKVAD